MQDNQSLAHDRDASDLSRDAEIEEVEQESRLFPNDASATQDEARDAESAVEDPKDVEDTPDAVTRTRDAEEGSRDADDTPAGDPFVDLSWFTLTAGESIDRFTALGRKAPKLRTFQSYCADGLIDAYKIQTVRNNRPVAEWLVNEESLTAFIKTKEQIRDAAGARRDAEEGAGAPVTALDAPDPPEAAKEPVEAPSDDRQTLAGALIDNARLHAEIKGKDTLITEMQENQQFLRKSLTKSLEQQDGTQKIAERMLETLETIAVGGKLTRLKEGDTSTNHE